MKKLIIPTLAAVAIILAGCVQSLHPLYTDKDIVFEPGLVGTWSENDSVETWTFEKAEDNRYKLTYTEKGKPGEFLATLVKLDGKLFIDLYPRDKAFEDLKQNDLFKLHVLPVHTVLKIRLKGDELEMAVQNPEWLQKLVEADPKAIKHEKLDDRIVVTADTAEWQKFVIKHADTSDAYGDKPAVLKRKSAKP